MKKLILKQINNFFYVFPELGEKWYFKVTDCIATNNTSINKPLISNIEECLDLIDKEVKIEIKFLAAFPPKEIAIVKPVVKSWKERTCDNCKWNIKENCTSPNFHKCNHPINEYFEPKNNSNKEQSLDELAEEYSKQYTDDILSEREQSNYRRITELAYKAGYNQAKSTLYTEDEVKFKLHQMYLDLKIAENTNLSYYKMEEWFDRNKK